MNYLLNAVCNVQRELDCIDSHCVRKSYC